MHTRAHASLTPVGGVGGGKGGGSGGSVNAKGLLLMFGYITADSFTSNWQSYIFKTYKSTSLHMMFAGRWKNYMEKTNINIFLDKFSSNEKNLKQCSGFNFIVKK